MGGRPVTLIVEALGARRACAENGGVDDLSAAHSAASENRLRHVYWIGGGSGAGKSTVAGSIAAEYGFRVYDTDAAMADHGSRASPALTPLLQRFMRMDGDERWVNRCPQEMFETFHWFRGEAFDLIVDDLLDMPTDPPVIVEGFRLLPALVRPLLVRAGRAVWLLPTPEFRRVAFESRRPSGPPWTFINETTDPDKALANLLERDRLFTDHLRDEAHRLQLQVIEIGRGTTKEQAVDIVTSILAL